MCIMDALIVLSTLWGDMLVVMSKNIAGVVLLRPKSRETTTRTLYPMDDQPQTQNTHPCSPFGVLLASWWLQTLFLSKNVRDMGRYQRLVVFRRWKLHRIGILRQWSWIPPKWATTRPSSKANHTEGCWRVNISVDDFWSVQMAKILARTKPWK